MFPFIQTQGTVNSVLPGSPVARIFSWRGIFCGGMSCGGGDTLACPVCEISLMAPPQRMPLHKQKAFPQASARIISCTFCTPMAMALLPAEKKPV